jgi:hypothetical protein
MARRHSQHVAIYLDEYDPGTATTGFSLDIGAPFYDATTMGDDGEESTSGIENDQFELSAWYDINAGGFDVAASAIATSTALLTVVIGLASGTINDTVAYSGSSFALNTKQGGEMRGLVPTTANLTLDQQYVRGNGFIAETMSATATFNTNAHDNGASSTATGTWYLHSFTGTYGTGGTGTGTVSLQHSANGVSGWVTIGTFVAMASNGGYSTVISGTGSVFRYTRMQIINAGSLQRIAGNVVRG